jgi:hypothetical protein
MNGTGNNHFAYYLARGLNIYIGELFKEGLFFLGKVSPVFEIFSKKRSTCFLGLIFFNNRLFLGIKRVYAK